MIKQLAVKLDIAEIALDQERKDRSQEEWSAQGEQSFISRTFDAYSSTQSHLIRTIKRDSLCDEETASLLERALNGMLAAKERYDRFYQPIIDDYHAKYEEGS